MQHLEITSPLERPEPPTERKHPPKSRSRVKKIAVMLGATLGIVAPIGGAGYAGIVIGYKNDILTAAEQYRGYNDAVKDLSPAQRYTAEFITGVNICNPEDSDNFFQTIGLFSSVEVCGRAESSTFSELDESLGSTCLADTAYNPATGAMITLKSLTDIAVEPTQADMPSLSFTISPTTVVVADQQTSQILRAHNCPLPMP